MSKHGRIKTERMLPGIQKALAEDTGGVNVAVRIDLGAADEGDQAILASWRVPL